MDIYVWVFFNLFVIGMLILDLGVFQRKSHTIGTSEALLRSGIWAGLALLFCLGIYITMGSEPALNFLTGYLLEQSLSVDNLFVFLTIFTYFAVPKQYLHRILFWGIISAIILRAIFIFAGVVLFSLFHWTAYLFGILLILAGLKLGSNPGQQMNPEGNIMLKLLGKLVPITHSYENGYFFVKKSGQYSATLLFVVLVSIESTDVMFAIDSVPAILAITRDPFIVYTSNVFAILGLRSLYFALEGMMQAFQYLHYGLAALLVLIGVKMLLVDYVQVPILFTLASVAVILSVSIIASLIKTQRSAK